MYSLHTYEGWSNDIGTGALSLKMKHAEWRRLADIEFEPFHACAVCYKVVAPATSDYKSIVKCMCGVVSAFVMADKLELETVLGICES